MADQYGDTPTMLYFFGTGCTLIGLVLVAFGVMLICRAVWS
jgi:hypothetical protein